MDVCMQRAVASAGRMTWDDEDLLRGPLDTGHEPAVFHTNFKAHSQIAMRSHAWATNLIFRPHGVVTLSRKAILPPGPIKTSQATETWCSGFIRKDGPRHVLIVIEFSNCNYKEDILHVILTQTGFLNGFSFKKKINTRGEE